MKQNNLVFISHFQRIMERDYYYIRCESENVSANETLEGALESCKEYMITTLTNEDCDDMIHSLSIDVNPEDGETYDVTTEDLKNPWSRIKIGEFKINRVVLRK